MVYWCEDIVKKLRDNKTAVLDEGRYILDEPLMLTEEFEIIGRGRVVIEGKIQVYASGYFKNLVFEKGKNEESIIDIKNKSYVEAYHCAFSGRGDEHVGIYIEPNLGSEIYLEHCSFEFLKIGLSINNNNFLKGLKSCFFSFVKYGLKSFIEGECLNLLRIKENEFYDIDGVFININEKTRLLPEDDVLDGLLYEVAVLNNYGRIKGTKWGKDIDTKTLVVREELELEQALESCSVGAIIRLKPNKYKGNKILNKPVMLIGEENVIFTNKRKDSAAFIINSDNIYMKGITILGSEDEYFIDGIKFSNRGGKNVKFEDVKISGVERRGISIWGEETNRTKIINCVIEEVIYQAGIYTKNKVDIIGCIFNNINFAVDISDKGKVRVENCFFKNLIGCIKVETNLLNSVEMSAMKVKDTKSIIYTK